MRAMASGVPEALRWAVPSPSLQQRTRRAAWIRRRVASGSGSAAAFVRRHAAEPAVLALCARRHEAQPGEDDDGRFRVYLDPVGHPFCLCWD
jgi:hypothetical protein